MRIDADVVAALRAGSDGPVCAYVYDLDGLRAHAAAAVAALPDGCELFYAVKANSARPVLEALAGIVAGFEVGSAGEIDLVRAAAPGAPIVFGGPGKTDAALAAAARCGVAAVHVESLHELRRADLVAAGLGLTLPVALRVNLAGPLPVATLAMAGRPTQFGIDEADVPAAVDLARRSSHLELVGFHFHCLSNHHDAPAHARLVARYLARARGWATDAGVPLGVVNAGGGIGVDYAHLDRPFDWNGFCASLAAVLDAAPAPPVGLRFECGRYLVAAGGAYVTEVLDVKTNHGRCFAVVRGGTHHFRLPASWGHSHPFTVIPVEEWPYPFPRPGVRAAPVTVAGELCSPKDVLARDVEVDELRAGDLLWFHHAGAYGWSISHHDFLHHPHPRQLFLTGGALACGRSRPERSTMPATTRYESVTAFDGGTFDAYCALPEGAGPWPGVVLFQEIFGINENMRGLAQKTADAGYVALVPDMFWRLEPRFERQDESGLADGIALVQKFDWERGGADIASTLAHLRAMPECNGRAGGVGFCFGGVLAYLFAATARPDGKGPDAAVSYYGSGVHGMLGLGDQIECPIMFHYGNRDAFIPGEQIDQVEAAMAGRPNVEFHRYDAGHAFSNWDAPSMYDQAAADEAWARTLGFFSRLLQA